MILPIIIYGNSMLRKTGTDVNKETPGLDILIENLWSTLDSSGGIGLAAPQINSNYKVFIVNSTLAYKELADSQKKTFYHDDKGIKETFIDAQIIAKSEEKWSDLEGCLSIPGIVEPVEQTWHVIVEYQDKSLNLKRKQFSGYTAKVIQHEYDHINGILFIDHLPALKMKLLKSKLKQITKGNVTSNHQIL